jgi:glycosyltransferase involved in cell wall biosynthesis
MVRSIAKVRRIDAIHFCNPPDLLFLVALPYKLAMKTFLVFDQHDLGPELIRAKKLPLSFLFVILMHFFERLTYRVADHVIVTNASYRDVAFRRGRKTEAEVTIVRSGPRSEWIKPSPADAKWKRGRRYLVGYVGVMGRQEGIEYLIDAAAILRDEFGLDVQFGLVGSGPDFRRLQQLCADRGVDDLVEFHGRLSDNQLRSILSTADVCVNPDEVNELNNLSTMNKIVEYMALGRPIVQFDVKEGRESAKEASLYAAANDAHDFAKCIASLLTDPVRAGEMGLNGQRRFVDSLCWETQVGNLTSVYERGLAKELVPVED